MSNTKKRTIIMITSIAVVIIAVTLIFIFALGSPKYGLKMSGSYYDNASDFAVGADRDQLTGLPKAYLEHITYEITEIDKDKMIATLVVNVPDISALLPTVVDQTIDSNNDLDYDELLELAKTSMEDAFNSEALVTKESPIQLSIKKTDASYQLIPNEIWNKSIIGNLENMYIDYIKLLIGEMTNEVPK